MDQAETFSLLMTATHNWKLPRGNGKTVGYFRIFYRDGTMFEHKIRLGEHVQPARATSSDISDGVFAQDVPMKINVVSDMRSNFKTKVVNYGINNVLVELYLVIKIDSWFVNPFNENVFGEEYEYVISSQIINGIIPQYFGGVIEKSSSIVTS